MAKNIIVYTTSWCGDCRNLKNALHERQIFFEERDIEKNDEDYKTMMGYTKGKRVIPTVDIEGKILINPQINDLVKALAG
jgi:mycoredoxin